MRKAWKIVVGVVVCVAVTVVGYLVVRLALDPEVEDMTEVSVDESSGDLGEVYGYAEPETVAAIVMRFNQKLMEQTDSELMLVDEATMMTHGGNYWYPLYEDVALVIVPVEFSGDSKVDRALTALIYTDKISAGQEQALGYFRCLVMANDEALSMDEVAELIAEAESLRERGEMANQGRGIFVAVNEAEDHIEYQVVRNYREE